MLSNKAKTGENQPHQIIIDSGASSINLNSTWKDAIQNITPTSESVLIANGIVNNMIVGQGYINILGIQFKCKYAPKIHKSVILVGILSLHGITSVFHPDGRLEISVRSRILYPYGSKPHVSFAKRVDSK